MRLEDALEALNGLVVVPVGHLHDLLDLRADHAELSREPLVGQHLEAVALQLLKADALLLFCEQLVVALLGKRLDQLAHPTHQLRSAFLGGRGDAEDPVVPGGPLHLGDQVVEPLPHLGQVDLVDHHDLRLVRQLRVEQLQLLVDGLEIAHRVLRVAAEHMHQHPAALDMSEEGQPQTHAVVGALEQPRDVGQHQTLSEVVAVNVADAQVGHQRREGIVGDAGPGVADRGQKRALPRIGHAHEAHVRDQLELDVEPALGPLLPTLGEGGGRVPRSLEVLVAPATPAAPRHQHSLAVSVELPGQNAVLVPHDRPRRHRDDHRGSSLAVPGVAPAVGPVPRSVVHAAP